MKYSLIVLTLMMLSLASCADTISSCAKPGLKQYSAQSQEKVLSEQQKVDSPETREYLKDYYVLRGQVKTMK